MENENKHTTTGWVIIPPWVIEREDLTETEKIILGRVIGLANQNGYCFASNGWLGEQVKKSDRTVSRIINHLAELNLVKIKIIKSNLGEVKERRVYPLMSTGIDTDVVGGIDTDDVGSERDISLESNNPPIIPPEGDVLAGKTSEENLDPEFSDYLRAKKERKEKKKQGWGIQSKKPTAFTRPERPSEDKQASGCTNYDGDGHAGCKYFFETLFAFVGGVQKPKKFSNMGLQMYHLHQILGAGFTWENINTALDEMEMSGRFPDGSWDVSDLSNWLSKNGG